MEHVVDVQLDQLFVAQLENHLAIDGVGTEDFGVVLEIICNQPLAHIFGSPFLGLFWLLFHEDWRVLQRGTARQSNANPTSNVKLQTSNSLSSS